MSSHPDSRRVGKRRVKGRERRSEGGKKGFCIRRKEQRLSSPSSQGNEINTLHVDQREREERGGRRGKEAEGSREGRKEEGGEGRRRAVSQRMRLCMQDASHSRSHSLSQRRSSLPRDTRIPPPHVNLRPTSRTQTHTVAALLPTLLDNLDLESHQFSSPATLS